MSARRVQDPRPVGVPVKTPPARRFRMWKRALAVGSLVALASMSFGCTATPAAKSSAQDRWHRIRTSHFELYADLDESTSLEAAEELETTRDALISAAWPLFKFPEGV